MALYLNELTTMWKTKRLSLKLFAVTGRSALLESKQYYYAKITPCNTRYVR